MQVRNRKLISSQETLEDASEPPKSSIDDD